MKKIVLSLTVLTFVLFLFLVCMPVVSAQYYSPNEDYYGSFRPTSYATYNSFRPYYSSYNSYPSYYNYGNRIYTYPSNYYRYPNYDYLNTPSYLTPRSNIKNYDSYPSYYNYYSEPIYLNDPLSSRYYYDPYPQTYNSRTNRFSNSELQDFSQNTMINSQDLFSLNRQPCQTYTRNINFNGKRYDVRFTEQLCDGITIDKRNSNSYSNSLNNDFTNNYKTFGNSQFYYY